MYATGHRPHYPLKPQASPLAWPAFVTGPTGSQPLSGRLRFQADSDPDEPLPAVSSRVGTRVNQRRRLQDAFFWWGDVRPVGDAT